MQLVFQDSLGALDPRMRAGAQVEEPLVVAGVPAAERRARTLRILDAVGLGPDHAERFPHQLSGGQRQRVVIARAMVLDPRILVLDEPIASLDLSIQAQIVNLLLDLRATRGLAYVFISHDIRVVRLVSHRVAVMYLGRFVETGPAADVLDAPLHPYTRMLRGAVPRLDAAETIEGRLVPVGDPPSLLDPPSGCTFHPRCPLALDVCRTVPPPPVPRPGGGAVTCHRLVA
jgi:oligopeptide/dipeptide ABC transporter ATP-binding protein